MNLFRFHMQVLIVSLIGFTYAAEGKIDFYSDSWALLIGINNYHNETHLNYAVADAEKMYSLLTEKMNFPVDNVFMLLDDEATLLNFKKEMKRLTEVANENDRVLIYFAGHGMTEALPTEGEEGYLLPVEGDKGDLYTTALPMSEMKRISDRVAAKDMLFLMDACYSGLMGVGNRGLTQEEGSTMSIRKIAAGGSRTVITAGRKGEIAQERAEWGHSPFVKNIVSGLEKGMADYNEDTYITGKELGMYLANQVTADTDNKQTPGISYFTTDRGEFVFTIGEVAVKIENSANDELSELRKQMKIQQNQLAELTELMLAQAQERQQAKTVGKIQTQSDSKEDSELRVLIETDSDSTDVPEKEYKSEQLEVLEVLMEELEKEMEELGNEMTGLGDEMESLETEIDEADDMEEGKEEAIKYLKLEMGRVGGEMGRLGGEMGRVGGEMGRVGREIEKNKKQKEDSVSKLLEQLQDLGIESEEIAKTITENIPFIDKKDKEEKKLVENTTFSKSPTHFFDQFGWARYNRSEGLYLQVNKTFQSEYIPGSSFYGGIGRAFHRNEYQWIIGYEQLVFNNIFQFYFEAFDKSITPDAWRVWDGENSLAAVFLKKDYLDWYRGQGFRTAGFVHIKNYISFGAEYNQVHQSLMNTVLDGDKFQQDAYKVKEGDNNYFKSVITLGYPIDIGVRRKLQFYSAFVRTQSTGNAQSSYIYDHFFLNLLAPYTEDLNFNIKVLSGASDVDASIWDQGGNRQNIFEIGGKGTLRGYAWKEFSSSHYFLSTLEIWFDKFGILYDRVVTFNSPGNTFNSDYFEDLGFNITSETNLHHSAGIRFGDEDGHLSFFRKLNGDKTTNIYLTLNFSTPLQYW